MALVSVVIVNYNAGDELSGCVRSLYNSNIALEIIIIDNASKDNSVATIKKATSEYTNIKIIENRRNVGFASACNQGASDAKGDVVLFLNPDCIVKKETIRVLYDELKSHLGAGMAGGLIKNPDGSEQRGCRRNIPTPWTAFVTSFGLGVFKRFNKTIFSDFRLDKTPLPEKTTSVPAISGACMMISKAALQNVGLMDDGYFLHCEDLDYCLQFTRKGWKVIFVPSAILFHNKGSCSSSTPYFVEMVQA